jgi:hypothetical protein
MRRWPVVLSAIAICTSAATVVSGSASAGNDNDPYTLSGGNAQAGPAGGVVPSRGEAHGGRPGGNKSPNLIYHSGAVRTQATTVVPIYWGTTWTTSSPKISWLGTFYSGVGGSSYMNTNSEYTNSAGGHVSTGVGYGTPIIDNSASPARAPSTSAILAEVAKVVQVPDANTYYPVYIDHGRGNAGYCAWHSYGTANAVGVTFGFFFNLDGDGGCDPRDPDTTKPTGVAALANVSGHELSEMVTDPQLNAWYDSQGAENADKCAWTFDANTSHWLQTGSVRWKVQGNWSNAAYTARSGYDGAGCLDTASLSQ